jgi:hypothetical protein
VIDITSRRFRYVDQRSISPAERRASESVKRAERASAVKRAERASAVKRAERASDAAGRLHAARSVARTLNTVVT